MKKEWLLLTCFISIFALSAQVTRGPTNPLWQYNKWMETAGIAEKNALSFDDEVSESKAVQGPWASVVRRNLRDVNGFDFYAESDTYISYNSAYPSGINDGALWQGKGFNAEQRFAFNISNGNLEARLSVLGWFAQNQDLLVTPAEQTGTGATIDLVQRYGNSAYSDYSFEGTTIGYKNCFFSVNAGIDSYWFGPALYNPIILSTNAAGFPHIKLGIGPLNTSWGQLEARLLYGQLKESAYFDNDANNDYRLFSGLFLAYRFPFFKNLTISASRTVIYKWSEISTGSLLVPFALTNGNDNFDQRISLTFRLLFPSIGFETYVEWARNDFSPNISTFLLNPNHTQAYTLGLRKTFCLPQNRLLGIGYEMTDLVLPIESYLNLNGYSIPSNFYNHGVVTQGYTNNGQTLGAGIGGGSFIQEIFANLYLDNGRFGLFISRLARNQTYIFSQAAAGDEYRMDVEMSFGLDADILFSGFIITPCFAVQTNMNRDYIYGNTVVNLRGSLLIKKMF